MIDFAFSGKFWHKRTSQPIALCRVAESAEEYGQTEQLQSPKRYSGTSSYEKMSYRSTCDTFVRTQAEAGNRSSKSQSKSDKINVSEMIVREVQQFLRN